ncbi:MAG TPA: sigma-70 family RNA polymerase sigma factor [Bacteroidia bacterium]|nr:sigma-70 family RNA polymerase sigma factor [Bacteroidia bacterium]
MNEIVNSDEHIIAALRNNDDSVLNVLYKLYFGSINHFIITNSGSEDDAKDIFQEAIIVFYQNIRNQNFELNCKIKTYLYSVSRLMWLKKIKKASAIVGDITDFEGFITIDDTEAANLEEREIQFNKMAVALSELGEPCKTLIEDFYIKQLSMSQISEKFGYTNSDNAKTQKYKCLMRLKKLFFKQEERLQL